MIVKAGAMMVSKRAALADDDALSFTLTVKAEELAAVGVPKIVLPASPRPVGSDPLEIDQVYGATPPVAFSACK